MKLVARRQRFTGEELHPLDSSEEPPKARGPVFAIGVVIEWLAVVANLNPIPVKSGTI
jgi:hypothetical protein